MDRRYAKMKVVEKKMEAKIKKLRIKDNMKNGGRYAIWRLIYEKMETDMKRF
jgi:hypothetical protein